MTRAEFTAICGEFLIDPQMVIEDHRDRLADIIADNDADALRDLLATMY